MTDPSEEELTVEESKETETDSERTTPTAKSDEEATVESEEVATAKSSEDATVESEEVATAESSEDATAESEDDQTAVAESFVRPEDEAAARFLELEAELAAATSPALPDGTIRHGVLVDASLVSTSDVPAEYPVEVTSSRALALSVELDTGKKVTAYLDWPADGKPGEDSTLGRLLTGLSVPPEQLGELYGQRVLMTVIDGHFTLYVPEESPRGTGVNVYGVIGTAVASIATLLGFTLSPGSLLFLAFVITTLVLLPFFTYRDAWYLRTNSDWDGGPLYWASLAMIPGLNVLSTAVYLSQRRSATFLR